MAGAARSSGCGGTARHDGRGRGLKEQVTQIRDDAVAPLRDVIRQRRVSPGFQPICGFREGGIIGHEALVRGPEGTALASPQEMFAAAQQAGLALELNTLCAETMLRAFASAGLEGSLFLNISPQLILQRGLEHRRVERFLAEVGIAPDRIVIELTEDYPTIDVRVVHEALML